MARSTIRSSRLGRNSCSGGSSVRMTTGKPSMALNRPAKSLRCMGSSFCSALRRVFSSRARIMACMCGDAVFGEEHVLGAAEADALGAELARACLASRGMSALARTPNLPRNSSAHSMNVGEIVRVRIGLVGLGLAADRLRRWCRRARSSRLPSRSCFLPSTVTVSHLLVLVDCDRRRRRRRRDGPCRARPPPRGWSCRRRAVRMPLATSMPWISSGVVSLRTRITGPLRRHLHRIFGGERHASDRRAGRSRHARWRSSSSFLRVCGIEHRVQQLIELLRSDAQHRFLLRDQPSSTISTAMRTAAGPVRLPLRVCSM